MNGNTKFAQTADMMTNHSLLLWFSERWRFTVLERLSGFQCPMDQHQHDMRHGNEGGRLVPARSAGDAPELVPERAVLGGRRSPDAFRQRASQPRIASGGMTALVFAGATVVAGTDSRPRTQVLGRGKLGHVRACLGKNVGRAAVLDAGNRLQQLASLPQTGLVNLRCDGLVYFCDLIFQKL